METAKETHEFLVNQFKRFYFIGIIWTTMYRLFI